ncbi:hypothetical protein AKJ66_02925 [candidate division MSBL1 archaeon SCGC-AAA259E22]|uniref:Uncharacterized protein n=1 Tax=candidate division MSBL1 archaeon SCGC-AAA259E22 TaxID=1698265 RepID=A0A133UFW8_9EURY|nr:hypothetical protein AKJ66_02925 [candidate division MSBL1 archaeon SCGC-AAA259E22]
MENMVTSKEKASAEVGEEKTAFIVFNDDESWFLLRAETLDEAVSQAKNKGKKPRYVIEEKLSTKVR